MRRLKNTQLALTLVLPLSLFGAAYAQIAAPPEAVQTLAVSLSQNLQSDCAAAASLNAMMQTIASGVSGAEIGVTYEALTSLEADPSLCATAAQAVGLSKELTVASICGTPAVAAQFPNVVCSATGAVAGNNAQPAAAFLTGGAAGPSGSGY